MYVLFVYNIFFVRQHICLSIICDSSFFPKLQITFESFLNPNNGIVGKTNMGKRNSYPFCPVKECSLISDIFFRWYSNIKEKLREHRGQKNR